MEFSLTATVAPRALDELQAYVAEFEELRGFSEAGVIQQCLLLGEEVGELFKAVRKIEQLPIDPSAHVGGVDEELADVLLFVCAIANRVGVDLITALRNKQAINAQREWRSTPSALAE